MFEDDGGPDKAAEELDRHRGGGVEAVRFECRKVEAAMEDGWAWRWSVRRGGEDGCSAVSLPIRLESFGQDDNALALMNRNSCFEGFD